ncbi:MAG: hypothetical protein Q8O05_00265 [Chloroflexota bacterium]|nr:hypothetical protein [Chloroflexota bacterium]
MIDETETFKGARMCQKAEELGSFWAYNTEQLPQDRQLLLLDNVQFIYELALAQLELHSLGAKFEITNGLREFKLLFIVDDEELRKKLAYNAPFAIIARANGSGTVTNGGRYWARTSDLCDVRSTFLLQISLCPYSLPFPKLYNIPRSLAIRSGYLLFKPWIVTILKSA